MKREKRKKEEQEERKKTKEGNEEYLLHLFQEDDLIKKGYIFLFSCENIKRNHCGWDYSINYKSSVYKLQQDYAILCKQLPNRSVPA